VDEQQTELGIRVQRISDQNISGIDRPIEFVGSSQWDENYVEGMVPRPLISQLLSYEGDNSGQANVKTVTWKNYKSSLVGKLFGYHKSLQLTATRVIVCI
jgi:hypothetical protein